MRFSPFRQITISENRRRIGLLRKFRGLVAAYEEQLGSDGMGGVFDTPESTTTRGAANLILDEADRAIRLAGVSTTLTWTPPALVGGFVQELPLVTNLFGLHAYQIPLQVVLDHIDRAVGIYTADETSAWIRTFNPIFWLGRVFDYVASLPFRLARRAGFKTEKVEASLLGRIVRLISGLLGDVASLIAILQALGLLDPLLVLVGWKPLKLPSVVSPFR